MKWRTLYLSISYVLKEHFLSVTINLGCDYFAVELMKNNMFLRVFSRTQRLIIKHTNIRYNIQYDKLKKNMGYSLREKINIISRFQITSNVCVHVYKYGY